MIADPEQDLIIRERHEGKDTRSPDHREEVTDAKHNEGAFEEATLVRQLLRVECGSEGIVQHNIG